MENVLNRQFSGQAYRNVVVSDLTYVRAGKHWNYICVLAGLFNREIIGYSAGEHKTADLVKQAFMNVDGDLSEIRMILTISMSDQCMIVRKPSCSGDGFLIL